MQKKCSPRCCKITLFFFYLHLLYWFTFFGFAIGDIFKILSRAFSGETMNHWLSREEHHASQVAVLFCRNESAFLILLYLMFYKLSLDLSKKETFTFKWMWTPRSMAKRYALYTRKGQQFYPKLDIRSMSSQPEVKNIFSFFKRELGASSIGCKTASGPFLIY